MSPLKPALSARTGHRAGCRRRHQGRHRDGSGCRALRHGRSQRGPGRIETMVGTQNERTDSNISATCQSQAAVQQRDTEIGYRTPIDRGAGCLLPEDFGAPLDGDVAGDLEEPLRVDAFGLIAFIALMRTASN